MKITKTEKIWLAVVVIFYALYNMPFFPAYGNADEAIVHALLTLIPLWIAVYLGLTRICKIYKIKDKKEESTC